MLNIVISNSKKKYINNERDRVKTFETAFLFSLNQAFVLLVFICQRQRDFCFQHNYEKNNSLVITDRPQFSVAINPTLL